MDWDFYLNLDNIKDNSKQKQVTMMKQMTKFLTNKDDLFYFLIYQSEEGISKVLEYLLKYSIQQQLSIVSTLCKYLENTDNANVMWYCKYRQLASKLEVLVSKADEIRTVTHYEDIIPKMISILNDSSKPKTIRMICAIALSNEPTGKLNIGVLRPDDLYQMTLCPSDKNEINFEKMVMIIRENSTKNKTYREIPIDEDLINKIKMIHNIGLPKYIICKADGQPYASTSDISSQISKHLGINFDELRSSYVTWYHSKYVIGKCKLLAKNMGHLFTTAVDTYNRSGNSFVIINNKVELISGVN